MLLAPLFHTIPLSLSPFLIWHCQRSCWSMPASIGGWCQGDVWLLWPATSQRGAPADWHQSVLAKRYYYWVLWQQNSAGFAPPTATARHTTITVNAGSTCTVCVVQPTARSDRSSYDIDSAGLLLRLISSPAFCCRCFLQILLLQLLLNAFQFQRFEKERQCDREREVQNDRDRVRE